MLTQGGASHQALFKLSEQRIFEMGVQVGSNTIKAFHDAFRPWQRASSGGNNEPSLGSRETDKQESLA
jgi:hypothetical protein